MPSDLSSKTREDTWVDSGQLEAGQTKRKLEALSSEMHRRQLKELKITHQDQNMALEEEFCEMIAKLEEFWKQKKEVNDIEADKVREELQLRQQEERFEYGKNIANITVQVRMTPEVLQAEKQIQALVKAQRYDEADRLEKKATKLKEEIHSKVHKIAQYKINNLLGTFDKKQKVERDAILKKLDSKKREIEVKREKDYYENINKFKALKENQLKVQKGEIIELEKTFQNFKPSTNLLEKTIRQGGESNYEMEGEEEGQAMEEQTEYDGQQGMEEMAE